MEIVRVEGLPIRIPGHFYMGGHSLKESSAKRGNYVQHRHYRSIYPVNAETFLVKITTDTGLVGWGETQGSVAPQATHLLVQELLAPRLLGADPFDVAVLRDQLYDQMRERGHDAGFLIDAIATCDIALWDLVGQATGQPIYKLLGGAYHKRLPCYISGVPASNVEEQRQKIRAWVEQGFTAIKLALGFGVDDDAERVRRLREALGDQIEIMIDAHWAYNLPQAIELGRYFEESRVRFMECPLIPEDTANQVQLTQTLDLPIALGEEYRTRYHFKDRLVRQALDVAQPDVGRMGITEACRVVTLCDTFGVPVAPHLGAGYGVYTAATLQVAAAAPNLQIVEFQPTQMDVTDQFFAPSLRPTAGYYALPQGPGLGIKPDEEKLRSFVI